MATRKINSTSDCKEMNSRLWNSSHVYFDKRPIFISMKFDRKWSCSSSNEFISLDFLCPSCLRVCPLTGRHSGILLLSFSYTAVFPFFVIWQLAYTKQLPWGLIFYVCFYYCFQELILAFIFWSHLKYYLWINIYFIDANFTK